MAATESELRRVLAQLTDQGVQHENYSKRMEPLEAELRALRKDVRALGAELEDMGCGMLECAPGVKEDGLWEAGGPSGPAPRVIEVASGQLRTLHRQLKEKLGIAGVAEERVTLEVNARRTMEDRMEAAIKAMAKLEQVRAAGSYPSANRLTPSPRFPLSLLRKHSSLCAGGCVLMRLDSDFQGWK